MYKPFLHFLIEDSIFKNDVYLQVGEHVFHWEI